MRRICGVAVATICAALLVLPGEATGTTAANPVQLENAMPGTVNGLLPITGGSAVEGYASEVSALPGDTLHFHVNTNPAGPYRIELYRLGFYGGSGSRLIGCVPGCTAFEPGQALPSPGPDASGMVRAGWPVTDTFRLPLNATSGYYKARFVSPGGVSNATYVIVRAPDPDTSAILVQVPVNTWQAYNGWGGRSLYNLAGNVSQTTAVSFDRPYAFTAPGNQNPLGWEFPLVLFLERSGYDVTYQTDADTDRNPSSLLGHRLVIDAGHDEYWTGAMRNAWETARDTGVNLAFIGANDVYWRVRYADGGRTLVDYKNGGDPVTDPTQTTGLFRNVDRPECELVGIQHQGGELNWPSGAMQVVAASLDNPWFRGTGFTPGSTVAHISGIETDTIPSWDGGASCGHTLTVFFHHDGGGDTLGNADTTAYTAPSGATVFAAGSKQFAWALADPPVVSGRAHGLVDPRLQRFMTNVFDDLARTRTSDLALALRQPRRTLPKIGGRIRFRATITDEGPSAVDTSVVGLHVPLGLVFVRVASRTGKCTRIPLQCTLPPLLPGQSAKLDFIFRVTASKTATIEVKASSTMITDVDTADEARTIEYDAG
jgi:N,N-dimethylformamidase beta subunit-like, C-terminal/Domain of unknown function DUF11